MGRPLVEAVGAKAWVVCALLVTAIGGSLIKPCIVGTVARTTTQETKSLGYSIYYTLVNIGGWLGPVLASQVRVSLGIAQVLVGASVTSICLFLATLLFFREPEGAPEGERRTLGKVLRDAALVFRNVRFIGFLVIFSGFWVMFWQVYDLFPFYVRDVLHVPRFELIGSLESFSVIFLTVPVAALMKKVRAVPQMTLGLAVGQLLLARPHLLPDVAGGGRGDVPPRPRRGPPGAALLRVRRRPRPEGPGRHLHGLRVPPDRDRRARRRPARRLPPPEVPEGDDAARRRAWTILASLGFVSTALLLAYDRLVK